MTCLSLLFGTEEMFRLFVVLELQILSCNTFLSVVGEEVVSWPSAPLSPLSVFFPLFALGTVRYGIQSPLHFRGRERRFQKFARRQMCMGHSLPGGREDADAPLQVTRHPFMSDHPVHTLAIVCTPMRACYLSDAVHSKDSGPACSPWETTGSWTAQSLKPPPCEIDSCSKVFHASPS